MPRRPRVCPGGLVFHVLNRAVARLALFEKVKAVREAIRRGCPIGSPTWQKRTAGRLGLDWTSPRPRPAKETRIATRRDAGPACLNHQ